MQTVDAAILALIRGDAPRPCARLSAFDADWSVRETWDAGDAILLGGTVTRDRTRYVRGSCSVELANTSGALSPQEPGDLFFGGERFGVDRGVVTSAGQRVFLPLFRGIVTDWRAGMDGRLVVNGADPLELAAQPFGSTVSVEEGMTAEDAVRALLEPVLGDSDGWSLDGNGRTVAYRAWAEDDDRLQATVELMADLGLEVFADRAGNVVLRPVPDPTTASIARTFEQRAGVAAMVDLTRSGSRRPYNLAVALRDSPDLPLLRAEARVTDPTSPIHEDRIGLQVAPYHRTAQAPDQAALNAIAHNRLVALALYVDAVGGSAVPDVTLDEDDVVEFVEPVSGANDRYRLDQVTYPVVGGGMPLAATKVLPLFAEVA